MNNSDLWYQEIGKAKDLRTFYEELKSNRETSYETLLLRCATLLKPLIQAVITEIGTMVDGTDPQLTHADVPVIVHSTAGLRDMPAHERNTLFEAINGAINGLGENGSSTSSSPVFYEMKDPKDRDIPKILRLFTTPKLCRAITGRQTYYIIRSPIYRQERT